MRANLEPEPILHVDESVVVDKASLASVEAPLKKTRWSDLLLEIYGVRRLGRRVVADKHFAFDCGQHRFLASEAQLQAEHNLVMHFERDPHVPRLALHQYILIRCDVLQFI